MFFSFLKGLSIGLGLIMAIGVQNAFVLKQGILRNHVLMIVLLCSFIDALMIIIGVSSLGSIFTAHEMLIALTRWAGALFLLYYGTKSFISFQKSHNLTIDDQSQNLTQRQAIITTLAFSFLNPHLYIDTCLLIGTIGSHMLYGEKLYFAMGACLASFIWFFALGFGARYLRPFFARPLSWKILDFIVGCTMYIIAISLIYAV